MSANPSAIARIFGLPPAGHFTDCPHGLDGCSFCTCPERRRPVDGSTVKWAEADSVPTPLTGGHLTPPPPVDVLAAPGDAGGPAWSREWPTVAGWYWFHGSWGDKEARTDVVQVKGPPQGSQRKPFYIRGGGFMYRSEGHVGLWQRIPDPVLP